MSDAPTASENRERSASEHGARRVEPTSTGMATRAGMTLAVRALLLGERLPIPPAESRQVLAVGPTTIRVGETGFAVLHRYGVVVLFAVPPDDEARLLDELAEQSQGRLRTLESEEARIVVDPAMQDGVGADGQIQLKDLAPERLQTVADVLAKSTVLDFHETRMAAAFDRVEPLTVALQRGRRLREETRELLRHIGDVLITEHRMVGRVEVSESPEVLWEHPELERLYLRLAQEYELRERDGALTRKLDLILRTVSTVLDITQNRRSLRVEWYIVILIVVEILLTLYEMLLPGG
jgi:uncharacterized Rmd1/YagE family protein